MIGTHTKVNVSCIVSVKLRSSHRELIGKNGPIQIESAVAAKQDPSDPTQALFRPAALRIPTANAAPSSPCTVIHRHHQRTDRIKTQRRQLADPLILQAVRSDEP